MGEEGGVSGRDCSSRAGVVGFGKAFGLLSYENAIGGLSWSADGKRLLLLAAGGSDYYIMEFEC